MFRLTSRVSNNAAQAVHCVRSSAMANNQIAGSAAHLIRMRAMTGILAQSAPYSSVPRQMTQQMTLKEVGIMGN